MRFHRRGFLGSLLLSLAALLGGAPGRWLAAQAEPAAPPQPLFTASSRLVLGRFADVIVPPWNGHPGASEGDFLVRFEALAQVTPGRVEGYRRGFGRFVKAVHEQVPLVSEPPDPLALTSLFEAWHREWRTQPKPSFPSRFFEMLRRDVMRTYYASPAGWRATGFSGPVHRATPDGILRG